MKTSCIQLPTYMGNDIIWLKKKVGDIVTTITPPKKLLSSDYQKKGKYPIIDQSQDYICGYSDDESALINIISEGVIIFGDHTCILKYVDFPFIQGADGIKILRSSNPDQIDIRYLYQFLLYSPVVSKEYKRHFSELKEIMVVYPDSIEYQWKLAEIFFSLDREIELMVSKTDLLAQYKKGMMQQLFPII